jgi:hypothetical protein
MTNKEELCQDVNELHTILTAFCFSSACCIGQLFVHAHLVLVQFALSFLGHLPARLGSLSCSL